MCNMSCPTKVKNFEVQLFCKKKNPKNALPLESRQHDLTWPHLYSEKKKNSSWNNFCFITIQLNWHAARFDIINLCVCVCDGEIAKGCVSAHVIKNWKIQWLRKSLKFTWCGELFSSEYMYICMRALHKFITWCNKIFCVCNSSSSSSNIGVRLCVPDSLHSCFQPSVESFLGSARAAVVDEGGRYTIQPGARNNN